MIVPIIRMLHFKSGVLTLKEKKLRHLSWWFESYNFGLQIVVLFEGIMARFKGTKSPKWIISPLASMGYSCAHPCPSVWVETDRFLSIFKQTLLSLMCFLKIMKHNELQSGSNLIFLIASFPCKRSKSALIEKTIVPTNQFLRLPKLI